MGTDYNLVCHVQFTSNACLQPSKSQEGSFLCSSFILSLAFWAISHHFPPQNSWLHMRTITIIKEEFKKIDWSIKRALSIIWNSTLLLTRYFLLDCKDGSKWIGNKTAQELWCSMCVESMNTEYQHRSLPEKGDTTLKILSSSKFAFPSPSIWERGDGILKSLWLVGMPRGGISHGNCINFIAF